MVKDSTYTLVLHTQVNTSKNMLVYTAHEKVNRGKKKEVSSLRKDGVTRDAGVGDMVHSPGKCTSVG